MAGRRYSLISMNGIITPCGGSNINHAAKNVLRDKKFGDKIVIVANSKKRVLHVFEKECTLSGGYYAREVTNRASSQEIIAMASLVTLGMKE